MRNFIGRFVVGLAIGLILMVVATPAAQAQMFQVLHTFTGGGDGARPSASLTFDARGNLYGTAIYGGLATGPCQPAGCGTVFQLTRAGSGWIFNPLYTFSGGNDGMNPTASVVFGPEGILYGSTYVGGNGCSGNGCGTVFSLGAPAHACTSALCPWRETILHRFSGGSDGINPNAVIFDSAGNLYGTTAYGGANNVGTVYELIPTGGGWTEQVLHEFGNSPDGAIPGAGLIFDGAGNLYSTSYEGGTYNYGTVYELTPTQGGGWAEQVLHSFFQGQDGFQPVAGLIFDSDGNLYGTTPLASTFFVQYTGVVFELTFSGGDWTEHVLHTFLNNGSDGDMPVAGVIFDAAGNLYGTTCIGGTYNHGTIFELMPNGGSWTEQVLHEFTGGADGNCPAASLIIDAAGNLYGTTQSGGSSNAGTAFELTPSGEAQERTSKSGSNL